MQGPPTCTYTRGCTVPFPWLYLSTFSSVHYCFHSLQSPGLSPSFFFSLLHCPGFSCSWGKSRIEMKCWIVVDFSSVIFPKKMSTSCIDVIHLQSSCIIYTFLIVFSPLNGNYSSLCFLKSSTLTVFLYDLEHSFQMAYSYLWPFKHPFLCVQ